MTLLTAIEAAKDLMLADEPTFLLGHTYPTRYPIEKDGAVIHQSATVIGQVNDHMNRPWLVVRYSNGVTGQLTERGTTGLGYPHAWDIIAA